MTQGHLLKLAKLILATFRDYVDANMGNLSPYEQNNGNSQSNTSKLLGYMNVAETLLSVSPGSKFAREVRLQPTGNETVPSIICALAPLLLNNFVLPLPLEASNLPVTSVSSTSVKRDTPPGTDSRTSADTVRGKGLGRPSGVSVPVTNAAMRVLLKLHVCMNISEHVSKSILNAISSLAFTDMASATWSRLPVGHGNPSEKHGKRSIDKSDVAGHREEGKSDGEDSEKEESDDEDEEDLCSLRVPLGLKNQGCTCYMNSLLQQLFLCKSFRDKILECKNP